MSRRGEVVVAPPHGSDDDLLLPRPPGMMRRFWARHPRFTDVAVVFLAFLFSAPTATIRADSTVQPTGVQVATAIVMVFLGSAALFFRRSRPLVVFAVTLVPTVVLPPSLSPVGHILLGFAAYAVAVYRSTRACWIAFAVGAGAIGVYTTLALLTGPDIVAYTLTGAVAGLVTLLIGSLIGVNVGSRRRYLDALIDRSRQLAVERDQQAQIAAAAERTRIAREMHDIVAHSLTVVVALSEGAIAATDIERARLASRETSETARAALHEMRAMLGVLREAGDDVSPLEPLEPVDPAHVAEAAQRAGFPVALETTGSTADAPRAVRFALGRIVQEGITNAMRHAPHATFIRVRIAIDGDRVTVRIRNDGLRGAPSARSGGFGLTGLRERVAQAGGSLTAGPEGASVWVLSAQLPLAAPTPQERS